MNKRPGSCVYWLAILSISLCYVHTFSRKIPGRTIVDKTGNVQTEKQKRATNQLVSALKALLRGSRYVGTKSGIRNYVKPGGYSTALKEFESIHYPLVVKDGPIMKGLLGDKWFALNKGDGITDPTTAGYYISVSPKSNLYQVEKRIWYVDARLL